MHEHAHATTTDSHGNPFRRPYLTTHPANAACNREFARLSADVIAHASRLAQGTDDVEADVRQMPHRCIVQIGPVAVTLTWLRSTADTAAEGQLLAVVWRGVVAPDRTHQFERPRARSAIAASAVWEGVYTATAESEATWGWQSDASDEARCTSAELAEFCAGELRRALVRD